MRWREHRGSWRGESRREGYHGQTAPVVFYAVEKVRPGALFKRRRQGPVPVEAVAAIGEDKAA